MAKHSKKSTSLSAKLKAVAKPKKVIINEDIRNALSLAVEHTAAKQLGRKSPRNKLAFDDRGGLRSNLGKMLATKDLYGAVDETKDFPALQALMNVTTYEHFGGDR